MPSTLLRAARQSVGTPAATATPDNRCKGLGHFGPLRPGAKLAGTNRRSGAWLQ